MVGGGFGYLLDSSEFRESSKARRLLSSAHAAHPLVGIRCTPWACQPGIGEWYGNARSTSSVDTIRDLGTSADCSMLETMTENLGGSTDRVTRRP